MTAAVTRGDIADTVGATGTLQAVTTVQVGTQVSGTIQELHADFNSLVKKGQVLARLDPSLFADPDRAGTREPDPRAGRSRAAEGGARRRTHEAEPSDASWPAGSSFHRSSSTRRR